MKKAIVIGGSMSGILAGYVVSKYFDEVIILERDTMPQDLTVRNGIPQAHHIHTLLARGTQTLERFFPGISADFKVAGAIEIEWGKTSRIILPTGHMPVFSSGVYSYAATRPLMDQVILKRLQDQHNLTLLENTRVKSLIYDKTNKCVTGVRVQKRPGQHDTLSADLVIDASGHNSQTPRYLEEIGYSAPEETVVDAQLGYATCIFKIPEDFNESWHIVTHAAMAPQTRGAIIMEIEDNRWIVTLSGYCQDYPPNDLDGFLKFAESIPGSYIYSFIRNAEPLTRIISNRTTGNRWRHYGKLTNQPKRLLVTGDAVCSFNPTYGQGMTTAALAAEVLDKCLTETDNLDELHTLFQKAVDSVFEAAWMMAASGDIDYVQQDQKQNLWESFNQEYFIATLYAIPQSETVSREFLKLLHMMDSPATLFRPGVVWDILRYGFRRKIASQNSVE